jgi:hypothetical protein
MPFLYIPPSLEPPAIIQTVAAASHSSVSSFAARPGSQLRTFHLPTQSLIRPNNTVQVPETAAPDRHPIVTPNDTLQVPEIVGKPPAGGTQTPKGNSTGSLYRTRE